MVVALILFVGLVVCIGIPLLWWHDRSAKAAKVSRSEFTSSAKVSDAALAGFEPLNKAELQGLEWAFYDTNHTCVLRDDRFSYAALYFKDWPLGYLIGAASADGVLTVEGIRAVGLAVRNARTGLVVATVKAGQDDSWVEFADGRKYTQRSVRGKGFFSISTRETQEFVDSGGAVAIAVSPSKRARSTTMEQTPPSKRYVVTIGTHTLATSDLLLLLVLGQYLALQTLQFASGGD